MIDYTIKMEQCGLENRWFFTGSKFPNEEDYTIRDWEIFIQLLGYGITHCRTEMAKLKIEEETVRNNIKNRTF